MSTVKSNNHQIGQSATATNNATWYQPATPDGTVRLGVGNAGATTADVITASSTGVTIPSVSSNNTFGFKNRIINGGMVIDQRNAGAAVTATTANLYTVDRWQAIATVSSKYSCQQNAGSVTPPAGFINYLGCTSLSAYSIGSTDQFMLQQGVEGYNIADLSWGTASAKSITLSFWVYSSLTGTFGGAVRNGTNAYAYPFTYSISTANTWTYISIVVAGPTSGIWNTTNSGGIYLTFSLGVGSTYSATAGSWTSTANIFSATGATSVVGTNGATFYITGVQLEVGSQATSFDFRSIGQELALCQRYFEKSGAQNTSITANNQSTCFPIYSSSVGNGVTYVLINFAVSKRTSPTVTTFPYTTASNTGRFSNDTGTDFAANSAYVNQSQEHSFSISNSSGGSITTGSQLLVLGNWYASAEL